jgi:hypothetical protein
MLFAASYLWFFDLLSSRLGYSKKVPTIVEVSDTVEGHPHEKQVELHCSSAGSIGEINTTLSSLAFRFTCMFSKHYCINDFARHYPMTNRGGHKIQPSPKIHEDFLRRSFYLRRRLQNTRLSRWIYRGGQKLLIF